jgi:chorismate mutase/prephenate dehydrogenase
MPQKDDQLQDLRQQLAVLDRRLIGLVSQRQELVAGIGRVKQKAGFATRDYRQEKEVFDRVRTEAAQKGLGSDLVDKLFALLIRSSLTRQERDRVEAHGSGSGRRALVIGGSGRLGRWFVRFLASQGFDVEVADPSGPVAGFSHVNDWHQTDIDQDVIVVTAPLTETKRILRQLADSQPAGLVFDTASLKGPLRDALRVLVDAGVKTTSIHPMFGPDTELLSNRHVIFVDLGVPRATTEAKQLFSSTMASLVDMELEQHDRLIAFVLGLSHALNLVFATALLESGEEVPRLADISSTTFDVQLEVASRVTADNPELYFEIQALNEFGSEPLDALAVAVERLRQAVLSGDREAFVSLMLAGREYLEERRSLREERL